MKKKLIGVLLAVLMCFSLTACAPMSVESAEKKMEKAGYTVKVIDGTLAEIVAEDAEAQLVAMKSGDILTAVLFEEADDANAYYKKLVDDEKDKEDQIVKKSGKWVYVGTEDAIEDFTKLF